MAAPRVVLRLGLSLLLCSTAACAPKSKSCCSESADAHARGRSAGCGKAHHGTDRFEPLAIEAGGLDRTYSFYVPASYDPARAYPLIFRFHGHGGSGASGGLEIEQASAGGALIISPDGLLAANQTDRTWDPASEAADLAYFDRLLDWAATRYCVDLDRVYAYGFSAGGGMAQRLACRRGDALRAVGTIAAIRRGTNERCQGMTAGFLTYGQNDPAVPIAHGVAVRDRLLLQNHCTSESEALGPSCVRYRHCAAGEPVVWCVTDAPAATAHDPGGVAAARPIWQFFSELPPTR
ncbi:MAG: hypothetical protein JWN04_6783 [Myxococcaceae bacterium]|nr:hypothetical protein [Myxococcaceae bacterium]